MSSADQQHLTRMAEDIVGRQARHRRHVGWAIAAGVAIVLGVAVPLVVVLGRPHVDGRSAADGAPTSTSSATSNDGSKDGSDVGRSDDSRIYAAVLGGRPEGGTGHPAKRVYVSDRFCVGMVDIDTGRRGTCHAGPIPPRLQQQIRGITGPHVVFTDRVPPPTLDAAVVRLGTITFERRRALVAIDSSCGPLCGSGQTDIVVRRGAAWEVVGTTGLSWIS